MHQVSRERQTWRGGGAETAGDPQLRVDRSVRVDVRCVLMVRGSGGPDNRRRAVPFPAATTARAPYAPFWISSHAA